MPEKEALSIHVHIIDPDGIDHYPVFVNLEAAKKFVDAMCKIQIVAEII